MLRIQTHGSPFTRGLQQAEQSRGIAESWIRNRVAPRSAGDEETNSNVSRQIDWLDRLLPAVAAECRGIASGLQLDEQSYFSVAFRLADPKCSTVAVHDPTNGPVLGKTDDVARDELGLNVLEECRPDTGYAHHHFHFACTTWTTAGLNEAGLALAMTGIPGPDSNDIGVPALFALRPILQECATVDEAIHFCRRIVVNRYGASIVLADRSGAVAMLEYSAAGTFQLPPESFGCFIHTNHVLADQSQHLKLSPPNFIAANSGKRLATLKSVISSFTPSANEVAQMFNHDTGRSVGLFQTGQDGLYTDFAALLLPQHFEIQYWTFDKSLGNHTVQLAQN